MMSNIHMSLDKYQGRDEQDRKFGYINGGDEGGYFFTWLPTLAATLDSLDGDEMAEPTHDWSSQAREFLADKIADNFADESEAVAAEDEASYS